jgi:hypothetical protein
LSATHFLNVDLEISSQHDLQPLVDALGRKVRVPYVGREHGKYGAKLEVARTTRTADSTVRALCDLIRKLPKPARILWDTAVTRSLSIGVQAGEHPNSHDFVIQAETVRAASAVDSQIVLTVYSPALLRAE